MTPTPTPTPTPAEAPGERDEPVDESADESEFVDVSVGVAVAVAVDDLVAEVLEGNGLVIKRGCGISTVSPSEGFGFVRQADAIVARTIIPR